MYWNFWCSNIKWIFLDPWKIRYQERNQSFIGLLVSEDSVKEHKFPSQSLCRVVMLTNTNTTRIRKQDGDNWVKLIHHRLCKGENLQGEMQRFVSFVFLTFVPSLHNNQSAQTQMCISHWVIFLSEQGVSHTNEVLFQHWLE